jgi:hypothetical protein
VKFTLRDIGDAAITTFTTATLSGGGTNPLWPDTQPNRASLQYKVPTARKQLTLLCECFDKETVRRDELIGTGTLRVSDYVGTSVGEREVTVQLFSEDSPPTECGDLVVSIRSALLEAEPLGSSGATPDVTREGLLSVRILQVRLHALMEVSPRMALYYLSRSLGGVCMRLHNRVWTCTM